MIIIDSVSLSPSLAAPAVRHRPAIYVILITRAHRSTFHQQIHGTARLEELA
jgi:hypothetical protein